MANLAFKMRKEGNLLEAERIARQELANDPNNEWNHKALAWVLYDLLKIEISAKNIFTNKAQQITNEFTSLNIKNDLILNKSLLIILSKVDSVYAGIASLGILETTLELFHHSDYQIRNINGKDIPSLAETIYTHLTKNILTALDNNVTVRVLALLLKKRTKFIGSKFIPYCIAKCYLGINDSLNAIPYLEECIQQSNEWYYYGSMGMAYEHIDKSKSLNFYAKAIVQQKDKSLAINYIISLIKLLIETHKLQEANGLHALAKKICQKRDWQGKLIELEYLSNKIKGLEPSRIDIDKYLLELSIMARLSYQELPTNEAVITNINEGNRLVTLSSTEEYLLFISDFPEINAKHLVVGQKMFFKSKFIKNKEIQKVVNILKISELDLSTYRTYEGIWVQDNETDFAGILYTDFFRPIHIQSEKILNIPAKCKFCKISFYGYQYFKKNSRNEKYKELLCIDTVFVNSNYEELFISELAHVANISDTFIFAETISGKSVFIPPDFKGELHVGQEIKCIFFKSYNPKKEQIGYRAFDVIKENNLGAQK